MWGFVDLLFMLRYLLSLLRLFWLLSMVLGLFIKVENKLNDKIFWMFLNILLGGFFVEKIFVKFFLFLLMLFFLKIFVGFISVILGLVFVFFFFFVLRLYDFLCWLMCLGLFLIMRLVWWRFCECCWLEMYVLWREGKFNWIFFDIFILMFEFVFMNVDRDLYVDVFVL